MDRGEGGVPKIVLSDMDCSQVVVPESARNSVVFVAIKQQSGIELRGTAFLLSEELPNCDTLSFFVTAKHVIEGVHERCLDDRVRLRCNSSEGGIVFVESSVDDWVFHDDPCVDVAVLPLNSCDHEATGLLDHSGVPSRMVMGPKASKERKTLTQGDIGPGAEVYIASLYTRHYGNQRNVPIVRAGTIACMPDKDELVRTKLGLAEAYLIEAHSVGGHSGSPVFVAYRSYVQGGAKSRGIFASYLIGVMHGHWNIPHTTEADFLGQEHLNQGIAVVTPIERASEITKPLVDVEVSRREIELQENETPESD